MRVKNVILVSPSEERDPRSNGRVDSFTIVNISNTVIPESAKRATVIPESANNTTVIPENAQHLSGT
ncbi:hypothetical protein [Marisediminitalea sp.]|uniref:hypothetical protein n=1 Tax=Marisediminitalea sp. TaxID=2662268 RepID=UPI00351301AB|tara:strand:- start:310 stop:510 length:201 start_codon:yes stop_codon:yes gene_type:complete